MCNIRFHNKSRITVLFSFLVSLFFITIIVPIWFINYLSLSGVGHFFIEYRFYGIFSLAIFIYFIIVGIYYYNIKIDAYVIQIKSHRIFLDFFRQKKYVDVPHTMLINYAFFNRTLTFNRTLMLKLRTNSGRIITKRFNLTLISENEIQKTSYALDGIIDKNK